MLYKKTLNDRIFNTANTLLMLLVIFITLYPFWHTLVGSFNEGIDYMRGGVHFWPRKFSTENYRIVFINESIINSYMVTLLRTITGIITHLLVTSVFAYAFSRKILMGKRIYAIICLIPMFFSGGLIPTYLLYKSLGLLDNFLVYIIPGMFSFWNVLIFQAFFRGIPDSIIESAKIDGAGEYRIYVTLILPLSKPVLAAIALFVGVFHWNSFFDSMMFTSSEGLQTIQLFLMKIIRTKEAAATMLESVSSGSEYRKTTSTTIQLATMMVTTAPIIALYPFLQKYFVKGIMIGSIKG